MAGTIMLSLVAAVAFFAAPSFQSQDPMKDFCRRFGHQTAVIDNRLFIDGGQINFNPLTQNPLNYTNTGLFYADLNVDNQGMPQVYNNVSKPANAPSVSGGVIWPDTVNKMLYLYGGEFQSSPQAFSMWSYDALFDKWASITPDSSQSSIQRSSYGGHAVAQDKGLGFWYGGWMSNTTSPTWGDTPFALSTFLQYDMVRNIWTNSTGPDSIGRAEGSMMYLPASDGGMLIYFGGIQSVPGNATWTGQPMDTILIYDIANAKWYTQKTTGDTPGMRRRFCGGATWAKDQSSYNIYIYGGASMPPLTVGYDDIYILSIPSFTWIKWYPTENGTAYPHHSLTCDVIAPDQMIVMGGTFPNSTQCDVAANFGFHNMDMGKQNPDNAKWASFNNTKKTYKVPSEILAVVGGSGDGGATKKAPDAGFGGADLSVYFTRVYAATVRTATRTIPTATGSPTPKNGGSKIGPIVGGVVGGVAALAIVVGLVFCFLKRRKPTGSPQQPDMQPMPQHMGQWEHSPQQPYQVVYPQQAPVQLATDEYRQPAPVELQATESIGMVPKPYGSADHKDAQLAYAYPASSPSSPSQSPPPAQMHQPGYFPPPPPGYSQNQNAYYPAPSPQHQYAYSPSNVSQTTPVSQQTSPSQAFVPSPIGNYEHNDRIGNNQHQPSQ